MKASDATGQTERLGTLGPKAKEEWWYPDYMKEKCPGLPNWEALKDPKCAEAFSTAETAPKGRYLGGPVTWEGFDDERVEALACPSRSSMPAPTRRCSPNSIRPISARRRSCCGSIRRTGRRPSTRANGCEFPEYTPDCYTDPKWGINPDTTYDCGKPHGEIWKYSWAGMKDKWPVAYKVAKAYKIDTDELNKMSRRGRPRRQDDRGRRRRLDRRQRGQVEGLGAVSVPTAETTGGPADDRAGSPTRFQKDVA